MADFINQEKRSKRHRRRKHPLHVDLTPMVDLAFLLITFFMLTTRLTSLKAMELDKRLVGRPDPVNECQVLNLVDSFDRAYMYEGQDLAGMRFLKLGDADKLKPAIELKKSRIKQECGSYANGKPREMICLIKLLPGARYQNLVDVMDEMNVTKTAAYSVQEPSAQEFSAIRSETNELLAKAP